MTFTEHLNELRVRLVRCIIAAFVGLLVCYAFAEQLFMMLMQPLITLLEPSGGSLIYTGLPEAFFTHLKVAAIAGLFVASPYIFYQLWMFIAPGLYEGERKYMIPIALCSALCFVSGALFGYYVVFPFGFQFFLGYASDVIKPMPSVREYFSFSTSMLFAFGFIFELPLFMFFLSILGIVTHQTLRKYRKFAILGSFVVAAVLTPPDVVSQTLMAGPLCILYEIGIWVAYAFGKKRKESPAEDDATAEAKG
ncbi:twin-arginine translocase subunit TatC [Desulfomicrobium norvegicum]